jgi:hypothetical protein
VHKATNFSLNDLMAALRPATHATRLSELGGPYRLQSRRAPILISRPRPLVAALKAPGRVAYSNPDPPAAGMKMVDVPKRPEFAGVHGVISSKGKRVSV